MNAIGLMLPEKYPMSEGEWKMRTIVQTNSQKDVHHKSIWIR